MFPSPLILDRHFFSKVEVNSHVDGQIGTPNLLHCQLELGQAPDDKNLFQLVLRLKIASPPDKKPTYTGEIHAVGLFRVIDNWPNDKANLIETYGASVLFAAIRELLMNLTSRGPWPPVLLNTFNFNKPKDQPMETSKKELESVRV
jgi:preprotein translocase subunit SecB